MAPSYAVPDGASKRTSELEFTFYLVCSGRTSFTESLVYLGSLLHYDLFDHHDAEARLKKEPPAFGALHSKIY